MLVRPYRFAVVALLLLLMPACEGTTGGQGTVAGPSVPVAVLPVDGAPEAWSLDERVAGALRARDIPATTGSPSAESWSLAGEAVRPGAGNGALTLTWELRDPEGQASDTATQLASLPPTVWHSVDGPALDAVADAAANSIAPVVPRLSVPAPGTVRPAPATGVRQVDTTPLPEEQESAILGQLTRSDASAEQLAGLEPASGGEATTEEATEETTVAALPPAAAPSAVPPAPSPLRGTASPAAPLSPAAAPAAPLSPAAAPAAPLSPAAAPAVSAAAPADPPPDSPVDAVVWWVQVGAFREEAVANGWYATLRENFPGLLSGAPHLVAPLDPVADGEILWRVRIGPFMSETAAGDLCGNLQGRGVDCFLRHTGGAS